MATRVSFLPALLLLAGCAPESGSVFSEGGEAMKAHAIEGWYEDYFTPTHELCGEPAELQPYTNMISTPQSDSEPVLLVSDECTEALLVDLKVDWDEVVDYDEFDKQVYASIWISVYALLAWPMGTVDDLRSFDDDQSWSHLLSMLSYYDHSKTPPFLRDSLIEELGQLSRTTGETRVNALVYNMLMSPVLRTSFVMPVSAPTTAQAMVDPQSRTLWFGGWNQFGNLEGTALRVHEMAHLWVEKSHVTCPALQWPSGAEGTTICDDTWEGAWGYEIGIAWLMALHHDWDLDDPDDHWHWGRLSYWIENAPFLILEP